MDGQPEESSSGCAFPEKGEETMASKIPFFDLFKTVQLSRGLSLALADAYRQISSLCLLGAVLLPPYIGD